MTISNWRVPVETALSPPRLLTAYPDRKFSAPRMTVPGPGRKQIPVASKVVMVPHVLERRSGRQAISVKRGVSFQSFWSEKTKAATDPFP